MNPTDPPWGVGRDGAEPYVLKAAPAIVRVLLPVHADGSDELVSWQFVSDDMGRDEPIDGATSWQAITEFAGVGSHVPSRRYHLASGLVDEGTIAEFLRVMVDAGLASDWTFVTHSLDTGSPVRCIGPLAQIAADWSSGFHGRAWSKDALVGVAAPSYTDSLFVSCSEDVAAALQESALEACSLGLLADVPIEID